MGLQKQVDIIKKELNWKGDELEGVPSNANPLIQRSSVLCKEQEIILNLLKEVMEE